MSDASSQRIDSLDGMRAISILLVMVAHTTSGLGGRLAFVDQLLNAQIQFGAIGVSAFFVISGFLITTLLLKEKNRRGSVDLRNFYIRRVLRIQPAYWCLLAVVGLLALFGLISLPRSALPAALAMMTDYLGSTWWLGHTWSLGVEEKFYLLWPLVIAWVATRRVWIVAIAIAVFSPLVRVVSYYLLPSLRGTEGVTFHTRLDTLIMGGLIALLWVRLPRERLRRWSHGAAALGALLFIFGLSPLLRARWGGAYALPIGMSLEGAATAYAVLWGVLARESPIWKVLNSRVMTRIGVWSYSLYLWQQLFLRPQNQGWLAVFPINWGAVFLCAYASYRWVESPFLRLRARFGPRLQAAGIAASAPVSP